MSFSGSLARKWISLNNKPCMTRPTVIDLHPVELNFYSLMISVDNCNESCNNDDDLSTKLCIPSETKT